MSQILNYLHSLAQPEAYGWGSILFELLLIGLVVYAILRFLQGTRGARMLQSIAFLLTVGFLLVTVVADNFHLERIAVLYRPFVWTIFLTTLVVFQPELRRGLMRLGEARWRRDRISEVEQIARPIATACTQLSKNKIGALIAIERDIGLSGIADRGVRLEARLTVELLNTIFWPGSDLHDLGVIVQHGRIAAAACPFPLPEDDSLDRSIGSRHRAAIGLSLDCDAIIVAVSEETGTISIAENGTLHRHIAPDALHSTLKRFLSRNPNAAEGWIPRTKPAPPKRRAKKTTSSPSTDVETSDPSPENTSEESPEHLKLVNPQESGESPIEVKAAAV